jgi:RNA polymerase sigma factor (sigma-70 family)
MTAFDRLRKNPADMAAFADWYREAYPSLFVSAYRITRGQQQLAEDLCQDAILAFVQRKYIRSLKDAAAAQAYLRTMVANAHIDKIRRDALAAAAAADAREDTVASPEGSMIARDLYTLLLHRVSPEDHEILAMMFAGDSLSEMAASSGISYSNAAFKVHKIRQIIKELDKT